MSDDSERKWVDERAFKVLEFGKKEIFGMDEKVEALDNEEEWRESGCPLLTPRARAVLEAVERAEAHCKKCCKEEEEPYGTNCGPCDDAVELLNAIRKAYKEKP